MGTTFYFEWEVALMEAIQAYMSSFSAAIAGFLSIFGDALPLVGIIGFVYWAYDKEWGKRLAIDVMTGLTFGPMIKNLFLRRRPYFDSPGIKCLRPVEPSADIYDIEAQGFSFPSGHSTQSFTAYTNVARNRKKKGFTIGAILLIFLIGLSRVSVGVHYPTDVLVGWALGFVIVFGLEFLRSKMNANLLNLLIAAAGAIGLFYCDTADFFDGYGILVGTVFGFIYEEKYVHFENTRGFKSSVLRLLGGVAVFLAISQGLKLVLPKMLFLRAVRYALGSFAAIGVYPILFKKYKIFK